MKSIKYLLVLLLGLALNAYSWAGYAGNTVNLTWEDRSQVFSLPGEPPPIPLITDFGTKTVGSGIEFTQANGFDVDISDGKIRVLVSCVDCRSSAIYSSFTGFRLRDANGNLPAIAGVSIELDSHFGLPASRISFDSDSILINLSELLIDSGYFYVNSDACNNAPSGLCVAQGSYVQLYQPELILNVRFAEIPEPMTGILTGVGLLGIGLSRRKKIHQNTRKN